MTALNLRTLLALTRNELDSLRLRYAALAFERSDPVERMFAEFLSNREAATVAALERYFDRNEHRAALDVHVRLGGGFPLTDRLRIPHDALLDDLIAVAEHSDAALAQLRERVELYAAGAELHAAFEALDALIRGRRQQLAAAIRELEASPTHRVRPSASERVPSASTIRANSERVIASVR